MVEMPPPPLPPLPPLLDGPNGRCRRQATYPDHSDSPSQVRPPSAEEQRHTIVTQHMTSFTLNKQLPWSVYTIVSPRNGTGSPSRRTSPTSSGFGASPRQSVEPSCLTSRTCTPGHASNARPAAGAAPSAPSPRPTSRGTASSRVHFPRGANDASVGQHSGGASPIEGTPKAAPIHAPTESRETRRTGAAIPKLYGVPNRSIGGAGSTYAPNAFYPRERIPIHPLHNTLGRAAGAGGGEMEQSASSSAQPEDYELAEVAVAAEVAPTMMHAGAPEPPPAAVAAEPTSRRAGT